MSQRFTLVSYFTASRSPSLILTAAASDSAGGLSNIGGLQVAWANAAWERHVGRMEVEDDDPVDAHRDDLLEFFTAADWDVIEREVHAHLADPESVGADAFELDLAGTVVSVTLLRGKAAVVLTLPPPPRLAVPSPPPSTKLPGFIVALSGTEMGRRIAEFPWETSALFLLSVSRDPVGKRRADCFVGLSRPCSFPRASLDVVQGLASDHDVVPHQPVPNVPLLRPREDLHVRQEIRW